LRFGLIFGVGLSAMTNLVWYVILPIPAVLAFYWLLDGIAVYAIAGITVALVYNPEKTKAKRR
jgi:hypothetical protein